MSWWNQLPRRSHDPGFLWRVALWIVAGGVLLSFLPAPSAISGSDSAMERYLSYLTESIGASRNPWTPVGRFLSGPEEDPYELLYVVGKVAGLTSQPPPGDLASQPVVEARGKPFVSVAQTLIAEIQSDAPPRQLREMAHARPPVAYAEFALALYWLHADDLSHAIPALRSAGEAPDARFVRQTLINQLVRAERWTSLANLLDDPAYAPLAPNHVVTQLAAEQGDWFKVLLGSIDALGDYESAGPVVLALLTGLCWFAFLLHAGRAFRGGVRWPLCLAGVVLGVLSIALTLFFLCVQETGWGLEKSDQLADGLRYYVLGVGLREELAKLLLLLPLVPWLVRGRSELEALLVSACVGLGFAIEENIGCFGSSMGASTIARLTTANFMHMSLTGLVGLAVCRGLWHPKTLGPEAFGIFGLAVLAHGLYDAFLALPALNQQYSMVAIVLYVLIVYRFFYEFNAARPVAVERLNVSFTFTVGVALVVSATFVYLSWQADQVIALRLLSAQLLANAVIIYLFLREAPDSLIDR